jgi:hypothetical protein
MLPLVLVLAASVLASCLGLLARLGGNISHATPASFPAARDLPWIFALGATGFFWVFSHSVKTGMDSRFASMQEDLFNQGRSHGGAEIMVICCMCSFLGCAAELTRRLSRSTRVLPFYTAPIVLIELVVLLALPFVGSEFVVYPNVTHLDLHDVPHLSLEPAWLTCLSLFAVCVVLVRQGYLLRSRIVSDATDLSLWKFDGADLIQFGGGLGSAIACAGCLFLAPALLIARLSAVYIQALLEWSRDMRTPGSTLFRPGDYVGNATVHDWAITGPGLFAFSLAAGIALTIILSALEFIRFNLFRLYRLRKIKIAEAVVALNE